MSNDYFRFKQFLIRQDRAAFKVGTDGVLLGAWVNITAIRNALDIGTGTGLIALMLAQRSNAEIHAIDIDETSILQASENISNSPWGNRIRLFHTSFKDFLINKPDKYDLIVINPPYYTDSCKSPDPAKNLSRHSVSLSFHELLKGVEEILDKTGRFALILPVAEGEKFLRLVNSYGFFLRRKTDVLPGEGEKVIRYMMEIVKEKEDEVHVDELIIQDKISHEFTKEYRELTRDFYLNF